MIRTSASEISPAAADWPIASPSPKLCRPIPVAISSASRRPGVSDSNHERCSNSSTAAAPGPTSGVARFDFSQLS